MYNKGQTATELWAVMNHDGEIVYSRGGSSSTAKLMVYDTEKKARHMVNNSWIKQVHPEGSVKVAKIYSANKTQRVRVKAGATVGMDFRFWTWPNLPNVEDPDMTFEVDLAKLMQNERYSLKAPKFGEKGNYGNGSLFVHKSDIIPI